MKKNLLLLFIPLVIFGLYSQTRNTLNPSIMNNYETEWKDIEKDKENDLPASAIKKTDELLNKALQENNTQQIIKSLLYKANFQNEIDTDSTTFLFPQLENAIELTQNQADKAILHSLLAELYLQYYQSNSWIINQRTALSNVQSEDITEWSELNFKNEIADNLNKSIESYDSLIMTPTTHYKEIIIEGESSTTYFPTLYDFLMRRAIEISSQLRVTDINSELSKRNIGWMDLFPLKEFRQNDLGEPTGSNELLTLIYYQQLILSLSERNFDGLILTLLSEVNYLSSNSSIFRNNYEYDILSTLWEMYKENPISTEIVAAIVDKLTGGNLQYAYPTTDTLQNNNLSKAYEWLKKGLEKYPDYERINILTERLNELESPTISIQAEQIFYPKQKDKLLKFDYRNIDKLKIKIARVEQDSKKTIIQESEVYLYPKTTYLREDTTLHLEITQPGKYIMNLSFRENREKDIDGEYTKDEDIIFYITDVAAFCRMTGEQEYEFYIVDRLNGKPLKDAWIEIEKSNVSVTKIKTNEKGFATYTSSENLNKDYSGRTQYKYRVLSDAGSSQLRYPFPYTYQFSKANNTEQSVEAEKINIFTDRDIYRPGQTIYFKSVFTQTDNKYIVRPIDNKQYEIGLYLDVLTSDLTSPLISKQTLTSNEFGSIAGEFTIPQNILSGSYRLEISKTYKYITIEEYKRPTFQISFEPLKETYRFGDNITIKGGAENFSGVKLQDATVSYTITRNNSWLWSSRNDVIETGSVSTNKDGTFNISFTIPENDSQDIPIWRNISRFTVTATITDLNGETQNENFSFAVGKVSLILSTNIPDKINKDLPENIKITATNLNRQEVVVSGNYTIFSDNENEEERTIKSGSFTSGDQPTLKDELKKLPSGKYKIKLLVYDNNGQPIESENIFVLYSSKDKRPPIKTNEWFITDKNKFDYDKNAEIVVGISAENITVLYELMKSEKVFYREQIKFNNENKTFVIPYKEEYGDEAHAVFTYVIDNKFYSNAISLIKEKEDKSLKLKFEVFRNKLLPGQQEEWRISIKDNKDNPAAAELLASMYDKSLDKIYPTQSWYLHLFAYGNYSYPVAFNSGENFPDVHKYLYFNRRSVKYPYLTFDILNLFDFNFGGNRIYSMASPKARSAGYVEVADAMVDKMTLNEESVTSTAGDINTVSDEMKMDNAPVQIRQNFNETAFFYPQLRTDKNGETIISFLVPESNTTWKFRALAYDKLLNNGLLEAEVISRKELMVTPNMPRFLREGDRTSISVKISNLSDRDIIGKASIEFFNPYTEEIINLSIPNAIKDFSITMDSSTSINWEFSVPSNTDLIGCRIVAQNEQFSDGEQHVIPVLSSQILITEAMPIHVNGNETKEFSFDRFINNQTNTTENYRLTFEYSSNPAWYAIQALPTLSNPDNENAVNWFASYYVNSIGSAIIQQYPKVKNAIEVWQKQGGTANTLQSHLQQNQELKNILLEETPWVLEAENEAEQIKRLSLLLDMNNSNYQTMRAINQLEDLQNSDGGWSWYKGMNSSRSITQYILYGFNQLIELHIGASEDVKIMQMNAIKYIDLQIRTDYNELRKQKGWEKTNTLSTNQLEYLYVRSGYRDIPIDQETREAERFYASIAEKNWTKLNLYERSILSVLCWRNGNKELAKKIIESLRERATIDNEKGMFWTNNRSTVFMSQSAISTHVFIMDAFKETQSATTQEMDLMKQWLISQKRTQLWETTHATTDAIYALLSTGSDWFASDRSSRITVRKEVLETTNKETITGYIKESWNRNEIKPELGKIKIEQPSNSPGYGAMYWQYFENIDKIEQQSGVLNVNKKMFKETAENNEVVLREISATNPLQTGDKVVIRLTVRADRDFGFIHLKDMRAACFEPIQTLSGIRWQNGITYYQSTKDASTNFFFDYLPKGTYVFEYPVYVSRIGEYSNGISTIQSMYAPEFISHTAGERIIVR